MAEAGAANDANGRSGRRAERFAGLRALGASLLSGARVPARSQEGAGPGLAAGSPPPPPAPPPADPYRIVTWPTQVYRGYSDADLALFDRFAGGSFSRSLGFVTDFLGIQTRDSFLAGIDAGDGVILGLPIPTDNLHAETVEWVGLLKCVLSAKGRFVGMELGAGYGPWVVAGAVAARRLGITDIHLTAVEADPGHFQFMRAHFSDNGLEPAEHDLIQAAIGVADGKARWPVVADPAADWGSRPDIGEEGDTDYLGRVFSQWAEIDVVSFSRLLCTREIWDMVHIDVQGWEADLCESAAALLGERVRWLIVATHTHLLHGRVMDQLHRLGWHLENEKPPRMEWRAGEKDLQSMTVGDGTQVWRNPMLD